MNMYRTSLNDNRPAVYSSCSRIELFIALGSTTRLEIRDNTVGIGIASL
jgi:hypothetical protein